MRLVALLAGLVGFIAVLLSVGCDSELSDGRPDAAMLRAPAAASLVTTAAPPTPTDPHGDPPLAPTAPTDAATPAVRPDLAPIAPPDLAPSDLAGLADCYGAAYCDRATMFCLRYFDGTPGRPGPIKVSPACFAPVDPCPNGPLDCACIQGDANLGPNCKECFDNQDGTFTCYEQ